MNRPALPSPRCHRLLATCPIVVFAMLGGHWSCAANFQDIYRWAATAADGSPLSQGDATTLRWSIVDDGLHVDDTQSNLVAYLDGLYGAAAGNDYTQRPWFGILETQFDTIAAKTGLEFDYISDNGGAWGTDAAGAGEADIRVAGFDLLQSGQLGEAQRPSLGGDVLLDTNNTTFDNPTLLGSVFQHELGHSLGLLHVSVAGSTPLMTTTSYPLQGPQLDDLYALTRLYGDKFEKFGGNDLPANATTLGTLHSSEAIIVGGDADDLHIATEQSDFVTIDGASDVDYYRFEIPLASEVTTSLTPRGPTYNYTPEGLSQQSLEAAAMSDLRFRLLASDAQTPLATVDSAGIGAAERIGGFNLPSPGTYYVEVRGAQNFNQFYELNLQANQITPPSTPMVFRDSFNSDGNLNADVDSPERQGGGQVDTHYQYDAGLTPAGTPTVEIANGTLTLRGVQGTTDADSPSALALRNFGPQVSGERWLLSLNVHLGASTSSFDAAFALTLSDAWPTGEPLSDDADLTLLATSNNFYRIVEGGGNSSGEVVRQGIAAGPDYFIQVLVDETRAVPEMTVAINGDTLLLNERVTLSQLERYLGLHVLTGSGLAPMASVTAEVDNLSIAVVTDSVAGDFNLDGVVDLADYTLWRNQLGRQVLAGTQADGNANGQVDAADYAIWRSHFGTTSATTAVPAAVPEPTALLLAVLGVTIHALRNAAYRTLD
ncbi:dockerin type I domain-containing protein [Aeoliella sp. ICT_H6.2]|uniref:Dockerin type I domain-containing protein n=1 Tax=Aeoliella straminimaris TaxID=2954799 RepID=A0A9X2JH98_9BACT|nr:dockerin type I domain-containing protein [Aeoliella straminimaris]MCO6044413.1 dockerin type I domain-containing protein [Aeoliella straminimaris]